MNNKPPTAKKGAQFRFWWLFACVGLLAVSLPAAEPVLITSSSKQISVRGVLLGSVVDSTRGVTVGRVVDTPSGSSLVLLDPAYLTVAAEIIRQTLQQELGWRGSWQGSIYIELHPMQREKENIFISSTRSPSGWSYRIDLPDEVAASRLVRTLVEVFLLEFAQRQAGERAVELPPWLACGLSAHLLAGPLAAVVLHPNRGLAQNRIKSDSLFAVRRSLLGAPALTFDQLNWPGDEQREGPVAEHYEACAHLFVRELLRLRGGPDCLRELLSLLPQHLNWQTAFFGAFSAHFQRLLDVEKWWSLVLVGFTGRDTTQGWSVAESLQRLDEALYTSVQVRLEKDEIPHNSEVSLQTVLAEWSYDQQLPMLRKKLVQLDQMRLHLAPEIVKLGGDYRSVLEGYMRARSQDGLVVSTHPKAVSKIRAIIGDALGALNRLDRQRERFWKTDAAPDRTKGRKSQKRS